MEYLRSKTPEMVYKEIYAHLILYNLMRKILMDASFGIPGAFSPISSSFQISTAMDKGAYTDKLGRSYVSWRGGRRDLSNSRKV
jgi:hypothetical protein